MHCVSESSSVCVHGSGDVWVGLHLDNIPVLDLVPCQLLGGPGQFWRLADGRHQIAAEVIFILWGVGEGGR